VSRTWGIFVNNTTRRRAIAVSLLVAVGTLGVLAATPASAGVDGKCGRYVCVDTAHHDTFVQDITVHTPDGVPGTLRAFVGNFNASQNNASSFRVDVNRDFPSGTYVCGGLDRGGRVIENVCVQVYAP
jgi:hypothetical protein